MTFLNKKLFRDIRRSWTQFFSVFLMAALSVLVYVGLEGAWHGMEVELNNYLEDTNLAEEWVNAVFLNEDDVEAFEELDGVSEVGLKTRVSLSVQVNDSEAGYLSLDTIGDQKISKAYVIDGKEIDEEWDGIWLAPDYADYYDISIGDVITLKYGDEQIDTTVMGTALEPDRVYYTGSQEFLSPIPELFGYGIVSETVLDQFSYPFLPNILELVSEDSSVRDQARDILEERYIAYYDRETLSEVSTALERVTQIKTLSYLFSFLFILLSILSMNTTIKRLIDTQSIDIATLKALGFSNRALGWHYASYGLFVGGVGSLVGIVAAPVMSVFVQSSQSVNFSLPNWSIAYTLAAGGIVVLIITICTVTALFASSKSRKGVPALFMRNQNNGGHRSLFEYIGRLWNKFSFGTRWTIRDSTSHPTRIAMGLISVCGSMMVLMAAFGAPESMLYLVENTFDNEFVYDYRIKVNPFNSEEDNKALLEELDGQWIQTLPTRITPDDGYDRVLTVLGEGSYVKIETVDGESIKSGGIYITEGASEMLNIAKGDMIEITAPLSTTNYEFEVYGIIASNTPQGVYMTESTWVDAEGYYQPEYMMIGAVQESTLYDDNRIAQVVLKEDQIENINEFVGGLLGIFMLMRVFAIALSIVVLYNLSTLSFTERLRDYSTLRVLGLQKNEIRALAMRENLATTLIGWLIGLPAGFWFLSVYVTNFSSYALKYYPVISNASLIIASALTITCSLTTTFLLGRRIQRIDMVMATKGIE